jgi:glycosyltransferase involved in cell wall biosynthesis
MTTVDVVVPTRGGARRLPTLFDSLRQQTHADWEALIVVDGDVDGSADVVAEAAEDLPVRALVLPENRGRAAALNAGFEAAKGDVLLRCDDDLELAPQHLARHAAHHDRATEPVGVIGMCRNVYTGGAYARAYGVRADARFRDAAYAAGPDDAWRYWAANVSVTAETWRRVGPYDERFRAYGWEDVDWGYRLHRLGIPVLIERDVEARHLGAASTTADRALRAYYSGAARHRFLAAHAGDGRLAGLLSPPVTGDGAWGRLVEAVAARATEARVRRAGARLDRITPLLPVPVAEKLVALLVEGSALAGHRAGRTDERI